MSNQFVLSRGVRHMVVASFFFAFMGVFVKYASQGLHPIQIVFFRNVFGILILGTTVLKQPLHNTGGRFGMLMVRGIVGTLSLYCLFYNMSTIGLAESISFLQTSPIYIALISLVFFKEIIRFWGWVAIFLGFGGILLVFKPDLGIPVLSGAIGITNGIAAAIAYTAVKELKKHYDTRTIVFSFMAWGIIIPVLSMLIAPWVDHSKVDFIIHEFKMPMGIEWLWLVLTGLVAMLGQVYLTKAYGEEKAGIVSAVGYINIPFAVLFGLFIGDPFPDAWGLLGITLIMLGGIIICIRRNI